jgi:hypothetical protein
VFPQLSFLFRFNFVLYWCVFTAFGFLSDLFLCCTAVFSQLCILFRIAFCVVLLCLHLSPFIQIYFYYVLLCFDNKSERKPKAVKTHQYNTKLNLNKNEICGNTAVRRRNKFHSKATVQQRYNNESKTKVGKT